MNNERHREILEMALVFLYAQLDEAVRACTDERGVVIFDKVIAAPNKEEVKNALVEVRRG